MDPDEQEWERLDRYVSGRGSPEELAELADWVARSPARAALAEAMRAVGQPHNAAPSSWDVDVAWRTVSRRMRWFGRRPVGVSRRRPGALTWAVAASVVLAIGSTLALIESRSQTHHARLAVGARPREIATQRSERAAFNLSDGTRVVLAPESHLTIPAAYNTAEAGRTVDLVGQAYFVAKHDSARPFRVRTRVGVTEDLGTEFVVNAYPEAHGMQVVVASGQVAVSAALAGTGSEAMAGGSRVATLHPGDFAHLDSAGTASIRHVDPRQYVSWADGTLAFNGTPLREVLPQLARWYDLDIQLVDTSAAGRPFTGTFRDQSALQVLDLVALSLDMQVQTSGRRLLLSPRQPPRSR